MNVHADLSFVNLILHASVVVQAVVALLALLSLWSWWQIFLKMFQLRRAARDTDRFEDEFWKGGDLAELYQRTQQARTGSGMEHIFTAGFREYAKHRKQGSASVGDARLRAARDARGLPARDRRARSQPGRPRDRRLGVALHRPLRHRVGDHECVSRPRQRGQATLANVAPGIAEALIATAIGLFAAIPAVIGYNRYTHDVDRLATRYETFIEEFSNILQRQRLMTMRRRPQSRSTRSTSCRTST